MLVESYIADWFSRYGPANLKPSTIRGYKMYIRVYIVPYIGNFDIAELNTYHVQNWIWDLPVSGRVRSDELLNAKTVIQAYRILSRSMSFAARTGLIDVNPCVGVELPRKKKYKYVWLSKPEDILSFIVAFRYTVYYYPVIFAISLGLRLGELLGLKKNDFNYMARTVDICRGIGMSPDNKVIVVDDLKNDSSQGTILVPDFIFDILDRIAPWDFGYIFRKPDGSLLNPSSFSSNFAQMRDKIGLPHVRFHDLRHSHASFLYAENIDMRAIQDRLRHSHISITMDTYTHTDVSAQKSSVDKLDELFGKLNL